MKIHLSIVFLIILIGNLYSQNTKQEIGFQTDNDSYIAGTDRYYTNGIFIFYRKALEFDKQKNTKLANKVIGLEVGQKMYTPSSIKITNTDKIDRPFAGYLFIKPHINLLYKNESNLKLSGEIGFIGKNSFAEETQRFLHKIIQFDKPKGWEFQIKNQFIVNFYAEYNKLLLRKNIYDLTFNSQVNLGNGFIGASVGPTIRIGKFNNLYNSVLTRSAITTSENKSKKEFYIYYQPKIGYTVFDATIEGKIFEKNKNVEQITSTLEPIVITNQIGLDYKINHFTISGMITFQSRNAKTMKNKEHRWGTIILSYLF